MTNIWDFCQNIPNELKIPNDPNDPNGPSALNPRPDDKTTAAEKHEAMRLSSWRTA